MQWTKNEIQYLKENYEEMSLRKMGKILGRDYRSIWIIIKHYGLRRSKKAIEKFQSRKKIKFVRVPCIYPELGDCWENTSHYKDSYGYPYIRRNGKKSNISRYVWRLRFDPIPRGMCICHKCDNPKCINPEHLFLGTHKDNSQDMARKGRARGNW